MTKNPSLGKTANHFSNSGNSTLVTSSTSNSYTSHVNSITVAELITDIPVTVISGSGIAYDGVNIISPPPFNPVLTADK